MDAVIRHTVRLQRMGKSDLPVVVRQTLNKAAYNVKTDTMPRRSDAFIHRKPTFFKANSRVEQAKGLVVSNMKAEVGFIPKTNDRSHSVEDLDAQEHGGVIKNRSLIALPLARMSNSWYKMVRDEAVMARILGHLIDAKQAAAPTPESRFTKSCVFGGLGSFVMSEKRTNSGSRVVFLVEGIMRVGGNIAIKASPVFSVKRNREVKPLATHFMEKASLDSARKMNMYYNELAEARLSKVK